VLSNFLATTTFAKMIFTFLSVCFVVNNYFVVGAEPQRFDCQEASFAKVLAPDELLPSKSSCWSDGKPMDVSSDFCSQLCKDGFVDSNIELKFASFVGPKSIGQKSQDAYSVMFYPGLDSHQVGKNSAEQYFDNSNITVVTVLDGHGKNGDEVAALACRTQQNAVRHFIQNHSSAFLSPTRMKNLVWYAFESMRKHFSSLAAPRRNSPQYSSGSTVTTVAIFQSKNQVLENTGSGRRKSGHLVVSNLGDTRAVLFSTPRKLHTNPVDKMAGEDIVEGKGYTWLTDDYNFGIERERNRGEQMLREVGYEPFGPFSLEGIIKGHRLLDVCTVWAPASIFGQGKGAVTDGELRKLAKQKLKDLVASSSGFPEFLQEIKKIAVDSGKAVYFFNRREVEVLGAKKKEDHIEHNSLNGKGESPALSTRAAWYFFKVSENHFDRDVVGVQPSSSVGDGALKPWVTSNSTFTSLPLFEDEEHDSFIVIATDGLWDPVDRYFTSKTGKAQEAMKWIWRTVSLQGPGNIDKAITSLHKSARVAGSADDLTVGIVWLKGLTVRSV